MWLKPLSSNFKDKVVNVTKVKKEQIQNVKVSEFSVSLDVFVVVVFRSLLIIDFNYKCLGNSLKRLRALISLKSRSYLRTRDFYRVIVA